MVDIIIYSLNENLADFVRGLKLLLLISSSKIHIQKFIEQKGMLLLYNFINNNILKSDTENFVFLT